MTAQHKTFGYYKFAYNIINTTIMTEQGCVQDKIVPLNQTIQVAGDIFHAARASAIMNDTVCIMCVCACGVGVFAKLLLHVTKACSFFAHCIMYLKYISIWCSYYIDMQFM